VFDISEGSAAEGGAGGLERRLLHAQKLESLGRLAGGVAHDFNNLLTGILGQASLARRQRATVPSEFRRALEQIEGLARRASGLTRQLLAYSGKGRFVIEPVDLGAVVRELAPMLMVVVPKAARLAVDVGDAPAVIMGDRSQLEQVVMNLITNAAEALDGGPGEIVARVSPTVRSVRAWPSSAGVESTKRSARTRSAMSACATSDNRASCACQAEMGSGVSSRTRRKISAHNFSTASAAGTPGNTFLAHASVGTPATHQATASAIVASA